MAGKVVLLFFLLSPFVLSDSATWSYNMLIIYLTKKIIENVGPLKSEVAVPSYVIENIDSQS